MITEKRLAEIEKLVNVATAGPWKFTPADLHDDWMIYNSEFTFVKQDDSGVPVSREDGNFIAASRTIVPELIEEIRRLQKQVSELKEDKDIEW